LGAEARASLDEKLDKMHAQENTLWSRNPTPSALPVFVVWKTVYVGKVKPNIMQ